MLVETPTRKCEGTCGEGIYGVQDGEQVVRAVGVDVTLFCIPSVAREISCLKV